MAGPQNPRSRAGRNPDGDPPVDTPPTEPATPPSTRSTASDGSTPAAPDSDLIAEITRALADLDLRVENLERHTAAPAAAEAERDRIQRDEELLSRLPNSYEEAVEQEAARKRRAEHGRTGGINPQEEA